MAAELPADAHVALTRVQVVDRTDVIESAAGHERPGRRVRTGHHPARSQRDRVHFVGRIRVPDDQLAVLRSRYQMSAGRCTEELESGFRVSASEIRTLP